MREDYQTAQIHKRRSQEEEKKRKNCKPATRPKLLLEGLLLKSVYSRTEDVSVAQRSRTFAHVASDQ